MTEKQQHFKRFTVLFIFLLYFSNLFSQEIFKIDIPWGTPQNIKINGENNIIPNIINHPYIYNKPNFSWFHSNENSFDNKLNSYTTSNCSDEELKYLAKENIIVTDQLEYTLKTVSANREKQIHFSLFPFVKENDIIKKITAVEISQISSKKGNQNVQKSYVTSSVLATGSGKWYKIQVTKSGVFKIDKAFLESCGINTNGLSTNSINIYGNGDGKLPQLNSIKSTDDLAKNAIYINGDNDGVFNDSDYILFYAWGPTKWSLNSDTTGFLYDQNIYSDYSYYYININSNNTPLRISSINSALSSNKTVNSYSYFSNHELDNISLVQGGQRWYGEEFDSELQHTINFSIPNIDASSPLSFEINLASNANSNSGNIQKYIVNGNQLHSSALPTASSGSFGRSNVKFIASSPSTNNDLQIIVSRSSPSIQSYLDNVLINGRRFLNQYDNQFNFRDINSLGSGNVSEFSITNFTSNGFVWDVTNRHYPISIIGNLQGSTYKFSLETDTLREFVSSDGITFYTPSFVSTIENQNLHGLTQVDYVIVTHPDFISQANRLADLHRTINGLSVHVVTAPQIYNEFSSGMLDPTAIKRFMKMFYDRSASAPSTAPKYLLLFGDGTYDPKNRVANNNNYIPTFQSINSENHISALVSDDYYGLLDDNESFDDGDLLDIGVGRLLISSTQIAKEQVDKIEHYLKNGSTLFTTSDCNLTSSSTNTFGDWRQKYVLIADDEQNGQFVQIDAETNYSYVKSNHSDLNCDKLYLDAYTQITNAGGQRYPDVYNAITDRVQNGALIINYIGHGGEVGVAEERVITVPQIQSWNNINKLNLLVSATCEFTKFDDPSRVSAGEWASLNSKGAAIALMTTTRSIYISINTDIMNKFYQTVFNRNSDNTIQTFGEIIMRTKNITSPSDNKRCFTLIGDPALKIALPNMKIVTDSVNGLSPTIEIDTLKALSKVTIKGHVTDINNTTLTNFNGVLTPTIFDKPKNLSTLGQDPSSPIIPFELQKNAVFKGQASVKNGYFEFSFYVPKDINYTYGNGKISYYANSRNSTIKTDAGGDDERIIIGGIDPNGVNDTEAPTIKIYLNDENFADGGITDETPILIAKLEDNYGINTVGNGIGHDITAVLDGETSNPIILNNYYTADLDSYQSGIINYSFPKLTKGAHTLTLKAWDINDNSVENSIRFIVQEKENISIDHVLNYPNPFTTKTEFYFEHNQVCNELDVQIQIYTISGKVVKNITQLVHTNGFRSDGISWDGRDDFGDQLAKGVYIYRLLVRSPNGEIAEKIEKLVLLK